MTCNAEIWKDVPGYECQYEVSTLGRVKSKKRYKIVKRNGNYCKIIVHEKILSQFERKNYLLVKLFNKIYSIHQLMAITFLNHIPNGNKIVVDHIDNNRTNNNIKNLQIITNRENCSKDKKNKSSKFIGVDFHKLSNKWRARIRCNGEYKCIHLGLYESEIDASNAYNEYLSKINESCGKYVEE